MDRITAEQLYRRHHLTIFRFLRRMTQDAHLAEDLAQEVFVRVIRGVETYDPRERDLAWLFRIARRLLADSRRSARRRPTLVPGEDTSPSPVPAVQALAAALDEALGLLGDE